MGRSILLLASILVFSSCKRTDEETVGSNVVWEYGNLTGGKYDMGGGWMYQYPKNSMYAIGVDSLVAFKGKKSAFIACSADTTKKFGTVFTTLDLEYARAKKIALTCAVKTENVNGWAGIWYRVDKIYDPDKKETLGKKIFERLQDLVGINDDNMNEYTWAFNNMKDAPIRGTQDWKEYTFVFDVPQQTGDVYFGALLNGNGKIWIDNFDYAAVGKLPRDSSFKDRSVYLAKPKHLGFENY
jgi:hypothetical protein